MNWNTRYSNDKELSIDADFTPDESFEGTAEMAKKMRQNPGCYICDKKFTYDEVANGAQVCSDECYNELHGI